MPRRVVDVAVVRPDDHRHAEHAKFQCRGPIPEQSQIEDFRQFKQVELIVSEEVDVWREVGWQPVSEDLGWIQSDLLADLMRMRFDEQMQMRVGSRDLHGVVEPCTHIRMRGPVAAGHLEIEQHLPQQSDNLLASLPLLLQKVETVGLTDLDLTLDAMLLSPPAHLWNQLLPFGC